MNNLKILLDLLLLFLNNKHQNSQLINIIRVLSSENNPNYELHLNVYIICLNILLITLYNKSYNHCKFNIKLIISIYGSEMIIILTLNFYKLNNYLKKIKLIKIFLNFKLYNTLMIYKS